MPVLLFDIDGTLVRSGGAGKIAMELALRTAFGVAEVRDEIPYSGRTDRDIGRALLACHGLPDHLENQVKLTDTYLEHLPAALAGVSGEVCVAVHDVMTAIHRRPNVTLGLLTGNVVRGAKTKLGHYGLWEYFLHDGHPLGGFGDHHYDRDDVAREALAAVTAKLGPVDPADIWVIGDTPLDVRCARAIGAKAVTVATGWHPHEELVACHPDFAFRTLADAGALVTAWVG
jgi:phosphoglycolate phosphatase-like HAD superfamily hydrolase